MSIFGRRIESTRQLAADTLEKMRKSGWLSPTTSEKVAITDRFVSGMGTLGASPLEAAVAETAREASQAARSDEGRLSVWEPALQSLSTGVTGSTGGVLAGIAVQVLDATALTADEKRAIGLTTLDNVARRGGDHEKALATRLAETTRKLPANVQTAMSRASLQALTQGVGPLTGPLVAKIGMSALGLAQAETSSTPLSLAAQVLDSIRALPDTTAPEKSLAESAAAALAGLSPQSQAAISQAALQTLSQGVTAWTGDKMAALGEQALSLGTAAPDVAALGLAMLRGIAGMSESTEAQKQFAKSVADACVGKSAAAQKAAAQAALSSIARGAVPAGRQGLAAFTADVATPARVQNADERTALSLSLLQTTAQAPDATAADREMLAFVTSASQSPATREPLLQVAARSLTEGVKVWNGAALASLADKALDLASNAPVAERVNLASTALSQVVQSGSAAEKKFAARVAALVAPLPLNAQLALSQSALRAVAAGELASASTDSAAFAGKAMAHPALTQPDDRAALGQTLLHDIGAASGATATDKQLADFMGGLAATCTTTTQGRVAPIVLSRIAAGAPADGKALCALGVEALATCASPAERQAVALDVLSHVAAWPGASEAETSFAHMALEAAQGGEVGPRAALLAAGVSALADGTTDVTPKGIAAFGLVALKGAGGLSANEQSSMAAALVAQVARTPDGASSPETRVAAAVREACHDRGPQTVVHTSALERIAKGEARPVGRALAGIITSTNPGAQVVGGLMAGIGTSSEVPGERLLASLAGEAPKLLPASVAGAATQATLATLAKDASRPNEELLGEVGNEAMKLAAKATPEERIALGNFYLNALARECPNPREQTMCRVATDICVQQKTAGPKVKVIEATLAALSKGGNASTGQALAAMALELLPAMGGDDAEQRVLAVSYLTGIARESGTPVEQALGRVMSPLANHVDAKTGVALAKVALTEIRDHADDPPFVAIARAGVHALAAIEGPKTADRIAVASALVGHLGKDPAVDPAVRDDARALLEDTTMFRTEAAVATVLESFLAGIAGLPIDRAAEEAAVLAELESLRKAVHDDIGASWQQRIDGELWQALEGGDVPAPDKLGSFTLENAWPEIEARFADEIEQHPLLCTTTAQQRDNVLGKASWTEWAAASRSSLTFGEAFPKAAPPAIVWAGANETEQKTRGTLIEKLVKTESPADERDAHLLKAMLNTLPLLILQELDNSKFTVTVTRHRVSNAHDPLNGRMNAAGSLHDMDEAALVREQGQNPRIVVRSHWKDGQLVLAPQVLVHAIAQAYEEHIYGSYSYSRSNNAVVTAFNAEKGLLPARLQTPAAFFQEMWTRFQLDKERMQRQFPQTYATLEAGKFFKHVIDPKPLLALQPPTRPVVNVFPDPFEALTTAEELNAVQAARGLAPIPYVFEIKGESQHNVNALVSRLGDHLRALRNPGAPQWSEDEAAVRVPAATFNDPVALEKVLNEIVQSGRGTFLVLNELGQVQADSPGFATLQKYIDRFGGQIPILLQGTGSDLDRFKSVLPTITHKRFDLAPLTSKMLTEVVSQTAKAEGYELSSEAMGAIQARARDGELAQSFTLWRGIKSAQTERNTQLLSYLGAEPSAVSRVVLADVQNAKLAKEKDPLQEMERLTGLAAAKREVRNVLGQVKLQKLQQEHGLTSDPPRLNLLFEGNPGTGKTTVAKLFAEALTRVGYLKNNKFVEVRIQDLLSGGTPEENVKRLFEQNKGGVIFIDEMHQLKDTAEGRLAFRAMIPYLGHPDYADTVFIGAGYKNEMRDLVRDIDAGAERRFSSVPFDDYNRDELGLILDKMVADKQRVLDEPSREAALMRLERERRRMKNFGNAGSVQSILEIAIKKQTMRLSEKVGDLTKADLQGLVAGDFVAEKVLTPAQVWKEIDALEGLEELKEGLHEICDSIEYDREMGVDPLESFEPYFILDGPPGTGKTTMARLIVKLMAAYDIIPADGLVESQGADLQAGYVGQTVGKVEKLFEKMWGQGGFIDEIGGIARAPEAFKADAIKTMLKQMEDNRGRFILVVADYADRVNDFLDIDPGIQRRFGQRFSLGVLSAESAVSSLSRKLADKELKIGDEVAALIARRMKELRDAPEWASSGDVRKLFNAIVTRQKTAFLEARAAGQATDPKELLPQAVDKAFDALMKEKMQRTIPTEQRKIDELLQTETAKATKKADEAKTEEDVQMSVEDKALLDAQAQVDQEFASQLANDPALQQQMEGDVNSAYIKRLSERMKCTPEQAVKSLQKVKVKVRKMVTQERVIKRFEYHCPYCGGINSPRCAYIGQSMEWKIQHSLKKPWDEVVRETKEMDVEQEVKADAR